MKAIICTGYGAPEVLKLKDIPKPKLKKNSLLIKVHATTVASGDCVVRSAGKYSAIMKIMFGLRRPRQPILGTEFSGVIEAIGKNVTKYKVGDSIFALTGMKFGGYAEYTTLTENSILALKPRNASFDEAAALAFGGTTALHFLRKTPLRSQSRILIYGASGAVGSAAVQLAKNHFRANVTGVCSTENLNMVEALGAENVLDYTSDTFQQSHEKFDVIFDAVGKLTSADKNRFLAKNGHFVSVARGIVKELTSDMLLLKELFENGKLVATIDRVYSLEDAVTAHRYADTTRKKGTIVLTV